MSHGVSNQQQSLNAAGGSGGGQLLSPSQGQATEPFYGTTTPPQDLNQQATNVDALTASLGGTQSSPVSPVHLHHQNGFAVASTANPYNTGAPQWTGANTLTYTQSMQPPDHRHLHATSYCESKGLSVLLFFVFLARRAWRRVCKIRLIQGVATVVKSEAV